MSTNHNFSKTFECIYYPSIVKSEEKAIQTLGGQLHLSEMISSSQGRMDLKFRPEDPFCKPTVGERVNVTGLVLKLRIVKKKKKSGESVIVTPQVLGSVTSWFQFRNMCDYQYLPVKASANSETTVDDLLPNLRFGRFTTLAHLKQEGVDYFLPPALFSKVDIPQTTLRLLHDVPNKAACVPPDGAEPSAATSSTSHTHTSSPSTTGGHHVVALLRKPRQIMYTNVLSFEAETIPSFQDPQDNLNKLLSRKLIEQSHIDAIRKVFEERPVVSKTVLRAKSGVNSKMVKLLLPHFAYYFYTGPFRVMWVRLGYDPRKDPSSCRYQVLDFRLKNVIGSVAQKMSGPRRSSLMKLASRHPATSEPSDSGLSDKYYVYKPGYCPPYKQMFYQLCDIDVPEVDELLAAAPLRAVCHERFGWYPDNLLDRVRAILGRDFLAHVDEMVDSGMNLSEEGEAKEEDEEEEEMEEEEEEEEDMFNDEEETELDDILNTHEYDKLPGDVDLDGTMLTEPKDIDMEETKLILDLDSQQQKLE